MTVGVAAIGGLGTLAVKLVKLYGAYVVAFSGSDKKKSAVLEAGADDFVNTKDDVAMAKYAAKCVHVNRSRALLALRATCGV
eukprot:2663763-Pleurochrysis_carterae.AAC.2